MIMERYHSSGIHPGIFKRDVCGGGGYISPVSLTVVYNMLRQCGHGNITYLWHGSRKFQNGCGGVGEVNSHLSF